MRGVRHFWMRCPVCPNGLRGWVATWADPFAYVIHQVIMCPCQREGERP